MLHVIGLQKQPNLSKAIATLHAMQRLTHTHAKHGTCGNESQEQQRNAPLQGPSPTSGRTPTALGIGFRPRAIFRQIVHD